MAEYLRDHVNLTFGFAFKSADFSGDPQDVRLLRGDNVTHGRLRWENAARLSRLRLGEFKTYQLARGDVVLAMDRPWIDAGVKYSVVRDVDLPALLVQRVARLRARQSLDQGYLRYVVGSRAFMEHVIAVQTGSAVPHISGSQIASFRLRRLPSVAEQRGIAATLGALDDKIDSNRRAIASSLQLSAALFRRWRATSQPITTTSFGSLAEVFGGATPKTGMDDYWDGHLAWATPTDVTALSAPYLFGTARRITDEGLASCSAALHPPGTIFMTSRATIGAFAINQVPCATNQGFIAVRPLAEYDRWFLFEEMRSRVAEMLDLANGSTFMELSRGNFKPLSVGVPSRGDRIQLHDRLDAIHSRAAQVSRENHRLAALRDSLLPELLSGRIRVPEAREAAGL